MTISRDNSQVVDAQAPHHFPNSDLDLWERLTTYHYGGLAAITDHFRGAAILPTWAWAGAPFVVPTLSLARSILTVSFAAANRAFLYQAVTTNDKLASVALVTATVGFAAGLRLDDGTDNNYAEVVLGCSRAVPTQWTVQGRYRVGGGAVATVSGDPISEPDLYLLQLDVLGAPWAAWGFYPRIRGHHAGRLLLGADLAGSAAAWTPTRAGLIFDNTVGATPASYSAVDWCDLDVT